MDIKKAKVLVTGGSLGIGKATAAILKSAGAEVVITGRNEIRLKETADKLGVHSLISDVAEYYQIENTVQKATELMGGLNVLINNAGVGTFAPLDGLEIDDFLKVYSTNVFGLAMFTKEAVKIFKENQYGNVINIGSTAATKGMESGTVYVSSKFALRGMTQCWQAELRKDNIRVMLVNPSEVTTAFGHPKGIEKDDEANKLRGIEIAHSIKSALEMDDRGFTPEFAIWATNPWN